MLRGKIELPSEEGCLAQYDEVERSPSLQLKCYPAVVRMWRVIVFFEIVNASGAGTAIGITFSLGPGVYCGGGRFSAVFSSCSTMPGCGLFFGRTN